MNRNPLVGALSLVGFGILATWIALAVAGIVVELAGIVGLVIVIAYLWGRFRG